MESPDSISGDEINELFQLTAGLERSIANFSITGEGVSGNMEQGYSVEPPPLQPPYDDEEEIE